MSEILPAIDPEEEVEQISRFIKATVVERGFTRVVIAVSGGVDSATALLLSIKALGREHVWPLLLPYGELNKSGTNDEKLVISKAGIDQSQIEQVDIKSVVDSFCSIFTLDPQKKSDKIRVGNIMARCRMIALYDRAKMHKGLVMGTENKSEHLLSYFTRFGDEASDIEPIKHLYKTQVYELAHYLKVPESILTKAPTAGLWTGQTDEGQFGFSYRDADQILYGLYEAGMTETELAKRGLPLEVIRRVKKWVEKNRFKHELPIVYKPTIKR